MSSYLAKLMPATTWLEPNSRFSCRCQWFSSWAEWRCQPLDSCVQKMTSEAWQKHRVHVLRIATQVYSIRVFPCGNPKWRVKRSRSLICLFQFAVRSFRCKKVQASLFPAQRRKDVLYIALPLTYCAAIHSLNEQSFFLTPPQSKNTCPQWIVSGNIVSDYCRERMWKALR